MNNEKHETYCDYNLTNLLTKLGFDWNDYFVSHDINEHFHWEIPLHIAQKWLREDKKLDISIHYDPTIKSQPYAYFIYDMEEKFDDILGIISSVTHSYSDGYFYKYEEAQEAGIKKAVEILLKEGK